MGVEITYRCDRCNEVKEQADCWRVQVQVRCASSAVSHFDNNGQQKLWCRSCCITVGIFMPLIRPDMEAPKPTIEDVVRDIVREVQQE